MRLLLWSATLVGFVGLVATAAFTSRELRAVQQAETQAAVPATVPESLPAAPHGPPADVDASSARAVAAEIVAPPGVDTASLERVEPRQPLSELSQALPPPPVMPEDWKGTILHRPVAKAAGLIEAKGYTVAIADTEIVAAEENCNFEGKSWDCGKRARTAFRSFLRGRSPTCAVPPEPDRAIVAADCRIGKQNVGEWLVANGWARAVPGGRFADAEARAKAEKRGIFGPPPSAAGLPDAPAPVTATLSGDLPAPIAAQLPAREEEPADGVTPPVALPAPSE